MHTVDKLPLKFQRQKTTHRSGLSIWEVPGQGLYRVVEVNRGEFTVETLGPIEWITLIQLTNEDGVTTPDQAFQIWLDIQTQTKTNQEPGPEGRP